MLARLVRRLDGLPLAIELAAARVEALGLAQLVDRLDDQSRLLASASRAAAARQRSLQATVEWSYQLLSEPEQQVFRRLAVFPGPFTLDAAEAVAGSGAGQRSSMSALRLPRPCQSAWHTCGVIGDSTNTAISSASWRTARPCGLPSLKRCTAFKSSITAAIAVLKLRRRPMSSVAFARA